MHHEAERFQSADQIEAGLRTFVARWRWRMVWARSLHACTIVLGGLLLVALFHFVIPLPSLLREIICDAFFGMALSRLLPAVARVMRREMNLVQAASRIEKVQPMLQQKLSTWMSCRARGESSTLFLRLDRALRFELRAEQFDAALPRWPMIMAAIVASLAVVTAILIWRVEHLLGPALPPWR